MQRSLVKGLFLSSILFASLGFSERARSPSDATVFIRVIGNIEIRTEGAFSDPAEKRGVELGTGSGFVFTPYGHVLTNAHVIEGGTYSVSKGGKNAEVELSVERVEVVLASGSQAASIEAVDPALDLAILSIAGEELPYLALGDSDALGRGEAVQVLGFPFGKRVEVGMANLPDISPQVSVSQGTISARRTDALGNAAYLQTTATVNPGNSGGPMVDEDGYVLGVVRLKLRDADGIGFAIPVNTVKDFLTFNGYDQLLPVARLHLGAEQTLFDKGLTLSLPDTMEDVSPVRLTAFTDSGEGAIRFRADRVFTPLGARELEAMLLSGGTFGAFRAEGRERRSRAEASGALVFGWARGGGSRMEYAIVELSEEKVLVRYEGPADAVAFNRSVLVQSLQSLGVTPLLTSQVVRPFSEVRWLTEALPAPEAPELSLPAGWLSEPSAPFPCRGLPLPDSVLAVSPPGDFTVSLRSGWWLESSSIEGGPEACGGRPGGLGDRSYLYTLDWLGVRYVIEGVFLATEKGGLQLELVAPEAKRGFLRGLGAAWVDRNRSQLRALRR